MRSAGGNTQKSGGVRKRESEEGHWEGAARGQAHLWLRTWPRDRACVTGFAFRWSSAPQINTPSDSVVSVYKYLRASFHFKSVEALLAWLIEPVDFYAEIPNFTGPRLRF